MSQQFYSQGSIGVLANVADHQEKQYRRHIEANETMGTSMALRLAKGEQLEELLGQEFLEECREKLKALASDNVSKERQLKAYVSAIRVVIDQASNNANEQENEDPNNTDAAAADNNNNNAAHEFKEQMETEYSKALHTIERDSVKVTQEASYLNLCKQLGEDQNEDEDDELAVVNNNDSNINKLKCPLTLTLMEDPVRSKVCKHSFNRNAIYEHLRRSNKCPVPGCVNNNMTLAELQDDFETMMRVRRYKKRQSASKRLAQSNRILDDEDEEEEFD